MEYEIAVEAGVCVGGSVEVKVLDHGDVDVVESTRGGCGDRKW